MGVLFLLTSCDGGIHVSGNVYESKGDTLIIDSVAIELKDQNFHLLNTSVSDKSGNFSIYKTVPPFEANYYLLFTKRGFKKDTVKFLGPVSEKRINHRMTRY